LNQSRQLQAHYTYDSWGNTISITDRVAGGREVTNPNNIGILNQIRYRGYYLDTETGYYYLMSRYYNPELGRFLNADLYTTTGQTVLSTNMFAYCENNPIIYSDPDGYFAGEMVSAYEIIVGIVAAVVSALDGTLEALLAAVLICAIVVATIWLIQQTIDFAKNLSTVKAQSKTNAQADAEIRTKIKNRGSTRYWVANIVGDHVEIGAELSFEQACVYVDGGGNVFAATIIDALNLAKACSNNLSPTWHSKHGCGAGYYNHYHTRPKTESHIFYF